MQKSFLLYATIISVLLSVFTYMYYSKEMAFTKAQNEKYTKRYQDSLSTLKTQLAEANYFSLERNDNAQNYFEAMQQDTFIAYEKLIHLLSNMSKRLCNWSPEKDWSTFWYSGLRSASPK